MGDFTPAPWRKMGLRVLAPDNQTICIAELIAPGIDTSEPHANARLIAAAPALFEALAAVVVSSPIDDATLALALDALTLATGEKQP